MTAVPQPGVPYAKVWIAGVEVTESKDRRLMSFEYTLVTGKTPTMTVALLDLEFDYVESLVRQSGIDGMYFEFGWLGSSNNQLWSERIRASAQKYSPQIFDSYSIENVWETTSQAISNPWPIYIDMSNLSEEQIKHKIYEVEQNTTYPYYLYLIGDLKIEGMPYALIPQKEFESFKKRNNPTKIPETRLFPGWLENSKGFNIHPLDGKIWLKDNI